MTAAEAAPPSGVALALPADINDLADEKVVGLLVRNFADRCLDVFHAITRDERSLDDGIAEIDSHADTLNALFLGRSVIQSVTVHPWNSPEQLGVYLQDALGLDFPPAECVRAGLIHFATLMMRTIQGAPETWEGEVEAMRLEMRDLLLGRRPLDDAGDDADALPMG